MSDWFKQYLAECTRYDMKFFYYMNGKKFPKFSWETEKEFIAKRDKMIKEVDNSRT